MRAKTAPEHLGGDGKAFWRDITKSYVLRPDELRTLEEACSEIDLIVRLRTELVSQSLQVRGSQGQMVASPLVSELRQHRVVLNTLIKTLKLPEDASVAPEVGDRATPARAAASARWAGGA